MAATKYFARLKANAPPIELSVERMPDGRYAVGRVVLEMSEARVELADPPATYTNCKRAG